MIKQLIGTFASAAVLLAMIGTAAAKDASPKPIGLFSTETSHYEEKVDGKVLFKQDWTEMRHVVEYGGDYGNMFNALDKWNTDEKKQMYDRRKRMINAAREHISENPKFFFGYYDAQVVEINRADSLAVSFLTKPSDYWGGAHGMYGTFGENFDTETGQKLNLFDVFKDVELLTEVITERIFANYGEDMLFDNAKEKIAEAVVNDKVSWTLDNDGATFYFNPYALAPYAAGILSAKVYFDFDKTLFKEKYRVTPHAYVSQINETLPLSLDGQMSFVRVTTYDGKCRVNVGAQEILTEGNRIDPYGMFIHKGDGKNFVWVDIKNNDTGAREILVYALEPELCYVGTLKRTFFDPANNETEERRLWMTHPDGFMLYKNVTLPNENKTDIGSVGDDGLLVFG